MPNILPEGLACRYGPQFGHQNQARLACFLQVFPRHTEKHLLTWQGRPSSGMAFHVLPAACKIVNVLCERQDQLYIVHLLHWCALAPCHGLHPRPMLMFGREVARPLCFTLSAGTSSRLCHRSFAGVGSWDLQACASHRQTTGHAKPAHTLPAQLMGRMKCSANPSTSLDPLVRKRVM